MSEDKKAGALEESSLKDYAAKLENALGDGMSCVVEMNHVVIRTSKDKLIHCATEIKKDIALLVDITAVDWMDEREDRFEVVYHFASITEPIRVRVLIPVSESEPSIASIVSLWKGADFFEREVWDMYGVTFEGHPDLRRILMYEEFEGFPLRKDYPVQGKQPRVKLISPEVRNTAMDMIREPLVQIRPKKKSAA